MRDAVHVAWALKIDKDTFVELAGIAFTLRQDNGTPYSTQGNRAELKTWHDAISKVRVNCV